MQRAAVKKLLKNPALFLAIFLALVGMYFYSTAKITGFLLEDRNISISIKPVALGKILFIDYSPVVEVYTPQVIDVEFVNTGSIQFQEHIEIKIMTWNLSTLATYVDDYVTLSPLESRSFRAAYTTDEPGYYWIYVRAPYSTGKISEAWGLYYVNGTKILPPIYLLPPPPPSLGGGAGAGDSGKPYTPMPSILIEYPANITLNQNQSTVAYVIVKNVGTAVLNNVILPITSQGVAIDVTPKLVPEILPGREGIFIISLSASGNLAPGTYPIEFRVISKETEARGHMDVFVKIMPVVEELNADILNYAILLKRIRDEARNATLDGKNVTLAVFHIDEGERVLGLARKSLAERDFDATRGHLKIVKGHIESAVLELARAMRIGALYAVFPWLSIIILLLALVVAGALIFMHHRKRAKEREKKEEEGGEGG